MNSFLVTTLVISGVVDLAVAGWAMAAFSRGVERNPLMVTLALAAVGAAALVGLAMRWIQKEKQEAYPLSIILGTATAVVGLGTFAARGFHSLPSLGVAAAGLLLGIVGLLAMNAPSVITDLRIPASRDQRQPLRRGVGRDRDSHRGERDLDRRRGRGGREGRRSEGPRGSRPPRDASAPIRAGAPERPGDRPERRDRPDRPDRPDRVERGDRPLRGERPERGDRHERGDRLDRPRRRPPVAEPTDGRGLSVVVSGTPPNTVPLPNRPPQDMPRVQRPETPPIDERLTPRPVGGPPRPRVEIPPMRPLRPDVPPREEGDEVEAPVEERRDQDRDRDRDRSRGRRRRGGRGGSRGGFGERREERGSSYGEERPAAAPAGEERDQEPPPRPRYEPVASSEPRAFEPAEPRAYQPPEPRAYQPPEPRAYQPPEPRPYQPPEHHAAEGPIGPIGPVDDQEPIDRISGFSERPAAEPRTSTPQPVAEFGRIKKPVLAGRRGKHSKPRENRSHKGLGSSIGGDVAGEPTAESSEPMRRIAPEGRIGMSDGIGPVDLSEPDTDRDA
jgi:hypothetical protein